MPNTDIDFLNALLVYCEPLSALMVGLLLSSLMYLSSLCDTRAFSIEIMAFSFTADKSKQYPIHSLVNTSKTLNRYPQPSMPVYVC